MFGDKLHKLGLAVRSDSSLEVLERDPGAVYYLQHVCNIDNDPFKVHTQRVSRSE